VPARSHDDMAFGGASISAFLPRFCFLSFSLTLFARRHPSSPVKREASLPRLRPESKPVLLYTNKKMQQPKPNNETITKKERNYLNKKKKNFPHKTRPTVYRSVGGKLFFSSSSIYYIFHFASFLFCVFILFLLLLSSSRLSYTHTAAEPGPC